MNIILKGFGKIIGIIGGVITGIAALMLTALCLVFAIPVLLLGLLLLMGVIMVCAWDIENFASAFKEIKENVISENDEEEI